MRRRIVLSSGNEHKIKEIKHILKCLSIDVISKNDVGLEEFDVVEDGVTLEENSMKKAMELSKLVDGIIIADDSGLFVDALHGKPGVYSARYAGESCSYEQNNKLLLKNLESIPMEKRTAYFKTVISVVLENKETLIAEGVCNGKIAFEPRGKNGFGYDPLFIVDGTDRTFAEMSDEEKNKISHRANALLNLKEKLEEVLSENIGCK
jgi:XTP/dITP diphosphohydrolase